eukprot:tig00000622_g2637.t1
MLPRTCSNPSSGKSDGQLPQWLLSYAPKDELGNLLLAIVSRTRQIVSIEHAEHAAGRSVDLLELRAERAELEAEQAAELRAIMERWLAMRERLQQLEARHADHLDLPSQGRGFEEGGACGSPLASSVASVASSVSSASSASSGSSGSHARPLAPEQAAEQGRLEGENRALKESVRVLRVQLEAVGAQHAELCEQRDAVKRRLDENVRLAGLAAALEHDLAEHRAAAKEAAAEADRLRARLAAAEQQAAALRDALRAAGEEAAITKARVAALEAESARLRLELERDTAMLQGMGADNVQLNEELAALRGRDAAHADRLAALDADLAAARADAAAARAAAAQAQERAAAAEEEAARSQALAEESAAAPPAAGLCGGPRLPAGAPRLRPRSSLPHAPSPSTLLRTAYEQPAQRPEAFLDALHPHLGSAPDPLPPLPFPGRGASSSAASSPSSASAGARTEAVSAEAVAAALQRALPPAPPPGSPPRPRPGPAPAPASGTEAATQARAGAGWRRGRGAVARGPRTRLQPRLPTPGGGPATQAPLPPRAPPHPPALAPHATSAVAGRRRLGWRAGGRAAELHDGRLVALGRVHARLPRRAGPLGGGDLKGTLESLQARLQRTRDEWSESMREIDALLSP